MLNELNESMVNMTKLMSQKQWHLSPRPQSEWTICFFSVREYWHCCMMKLKGCWGCCGLLGLLCTAI